MNDKRGYLMPVDAEPDLAELMGYSLDLLHGNLGKLEARSVAVYVDACFTGDSEAGMLFRDASPVRAQARLPEAGDGGVTLLTAASGKQLASWDRKAEHGLFTHHLLDGLYGGADLNQDGRVTAGEAKEYLDNHMTPAAQVAGREQVATLTGGKEGVLSVARFPARSAGEVKARDGELEKARQELEALRQEREAWEKERQRLARQVTEKQGELERLRERVRPERTPEMVEAALKLKHEGFVEIQRGLVSLGKRLGRVDGVFGERTRLAIRKWQEERRVEATGYLTRDQAEALKAAGREAVEQERKAEAERKAKEVAAARAREKRPGREFQDCAGCPEMVVVPAGEYMMGSRYGVGYNDERPRHRVRIGDVFAVGKYEVTFAEWDACVVAGGCGGYRPDDAGWGRGRRPVVNVSWGDAQAYVEWLSRKTGERYRLLSEGEWEYVARAGTETAYWWGEEIGSERANCNGCGSRWNGEKTAPVGSFEANGFGLHDVHGNVWEWVEDCWHGNYGGAPTDGSAWTSGGNCGRRVLRGGSWSGKPGSLRSAVRVWNSAGRRINYNGFRIARTFTP